MDDPNKIGVGLITTDNKCGWSLIDPATSKWPEGLFPPCDKPSYFFEDGLAKLTLTFIAMPAEIAGIVKSVLWVQVNPEQVDPDFVPEKDPIGKRISMKCTGVFATCLPADEATEQFYKDYYILPSSRFEFIDGECHIHLQCLAVNR